MVLLLELYICWEKWDNIYEYDDSDYALRENSEYIGSEIYNRCIHLQESTSHYIIKSINKNIIFLGSINFKR